MIIYKFSLFHHFKPRTDLMMRFEAKKKEAWPRLAGGFI